MKFYLIYVEGSDNGEVYSVREGPFETRREVELAVEVLLTNSEAWSDVKYFIISSKDEVGIEEKKKY
jgi:hypothetical protein